MGRFADLDAVTVDANGTLVGLLDPIPRLTELLRERGVERPREAVAVAFEAEGRHYRPRSLEGRDDTSLEALQRECAGVFLAALDVDIDPATFASAYVAALQFEVLPGVHEALDELRARGLELAVVANWDLTLDERLRTLGLADRFAAVVSSAGAGAAKPDPAPFWLALERLGVTAGRALHIGDSTADEEGARAAGMDFAWAPIQTALKAWR